MTAPWIDKGSEFAGWRAYFEGSWRINRRIDDRRGARAGAASGVATFAAEPDDADSRLTCTEAMTIDYGGSRIAGEQTTIWRFQGPLGPDLYFRDARFFCAMRFHEEHGVWSAEFSHDCGEDRYEGAARIADENNWRLVWNVRGPRKDYSLDTAYSRLIDMRRKAPACQRPERAAGCAGNFARDIAR